MVRFSLLAGLVTAAVLAVPAMLRAETIVLRNETPVTLTVQSACVVKGVVRTQPPVVVKPGGVIRITLPGNKLISIYDSRLPNRVLFQDTLAASNEDQLYSMLADPAAGKVRLEPVKAPVSGPAMPGRGMPGPSVPGQRPGGPAMPGPSRP